MEMQAFANFIAKIAKDPTPLNDNLVTQLTDEFRKIVGDTEITPPVESPGPDGAPLSEYNEALAQVWEAMLSRTEEARKLQELQAMLESDPEKKKRVATVLKAILANLQPERG